MRYAFDLYVLDTSTEQLLGPNGPITLRPITFRVLCELVESAPALLSKTELQERVWGHQALSESALAQSIKELRTAFADDSESPRIILTRHRRGYQFKPEVRAALPQASIPSQSGSRGSPAMSRKAITLLLAIVILMSLIAHIWWQAAENLPPIVDIHTLLNQGLSESALRQLEHLSTEPAQQSLMEQLMADLGLRVDGDDEYSRGASNAVSDPKPDRATPNASPLRADGITRRLQDLARATRERPSLSWVWIRRLEAEVRLGRCNDAKDVRDQAHTAGLAASYLTLIDASIALCRRHYALAREHAEAAESLAEANQLVGYRARSIQLQADALRGLGQFENALSLANQAVLAFDIAEERLGAASARLSVVELLHDLGRYDEADQVLEAARAEFLRQQAGPRLRQLLGLQAALSYRRGDYVKALPLAREARHAADSAFSHAESQALALTEAEILNRSGNVDAARALFELTLQAAEARGDRQLMARIRTNLAGIAGRQGRLEDAIGDFELARRAFAELGDVHGEALCNANLATMDARANRIDRARERYSNAITLFRAMDARSDLARNLYNLALLKRRAGDYGAARKELDEAQPLLEALGERDALLFALAAKAELALLQADPLTARDALQHAEPLMTQSPMSRARILSVQAHLARDTGDPSAERLLSEALQLREKAGATPWVHASRFDQLRLLIDHSPSPQAVADLDALRQSQLRQNEHSDAFATGVLMVEAYRRRQQYPQASRLAAVLEADHSSALSEDRWRLRLQQVLLQADPSTALSTLAREANSAGAFALALEARICAGDQAALGQAKSSGMHRLANLRPGC